MSRVMVDMNILIRFFGAPEDFVSSLGAYERIVISPIVVGEFWAGINNTRRGRESRFAFEAFLPFEKKEKQIITGSSTRLTTVSMMPISGLSPPSRLTIW